MHSPGHVHTWPLEKSMGRSRGSPTQGPLWGQPAGAPACPDPSQHTLAHPCPVPPQPRTFSPDPSFCRVLLSQATTFLLSPYPSGFTVVVLFATLSFFNSLLPSLPVSYSPILLGKTKNEKTSFTGTLRCPQFMAEHTRCLSNIRKHPNCNRNYFLSTFIHIKARVSMT